MTENKSFVLTEEVSRARIAYVLKSYRKEMGGLCENEALSDAERRSLKGQKTTVENFLRSYANYNVDGDFHSVSYVPKIGSCDYRYYPLRNQGVVILPRNVKNALLSDMVDIDTKSSNPNYMIQTCEMQDVQCPQLREYFANKEEYHKMVKKAYGLNISDKSCKQLFLSLINGGTFGGWVKEHSATDPKNGIITSGFTAGDNLKYYDCDCRDKEYRKLLLGEDDEEETKKRKISKPKVQMTEFIYSFAMEMVDICKALRHKGCNQADWDRAVEAKKQKNKSSAMGAFMYLFMIRAETMCMVGTVIPYLLNNGYATYAGRDNVMCYEWDGIKLQRSVVEAKGGVEYLISTLQELVFKENGYHIILELKPMETGIVMDDEMINAMSEEEINSLLGGTKDKFDELFQSLELMVTPGQIANYAIANMFKDKVYYCTANTTLYVYADNNYVIRDRSSDTLSQETTDTIFCKQILTAVDEEDDNALRQLAADYKANQTEVCPPKWESTVKGGESGGGIGELILMQKLKAALPAYIGSLLAEYLPVLSSELREVSVDKKEIAKYYQVVALFKKLYRYLGQNINIREIITSIIQSADTAIQTEIFDVEEGVLGFQNGWYNLKDQTFNPYTFLTLISRRTEYAFDENDYRYWIDKFANQQHQDSVLWSALSKIMPRKTHGDELYLMLLVLASACMGVQIQALVFWIGEGANGKSVLENLLKSILGKEFYYASRMHIIFAPIQGNGASEDHCKIKNKRVVVMSEAGDAVLNTAESNHLTGGNDINASEKHGHLQEITPKCEFICHANKLSVLQKTAQDAEKRRYILLKLIAKFCLLSDMESFREKGWEYVFEKDSRMEKVEHLKIYRMEFFALMSGVWKHIYDVHKGIPHDALHTHFKTCTLFYEEMQAHLESSGPVHELFEGEFKPCEIDSIIKLPLDSVVKYLVDKAARRQNNITLSEVENYLKGRKIVKRNDKQPIRVRPDYKADGKMPGLLHIKALQNLISIGAIRRRNDKKAFKAREVVEGFELKVTISEDHALRVDNICIIPSTGSEEKKKASEEQKRALEDQIKALETEEWRDE